MSVRCVNWNDGGAIARDGEGITEGGLGQVDFPPPSDPHLQKVSSFQFADIGMASRAQVE